MFMRVLSGMVGLLVLAWIMGAPVAAGSSSGACPNEEVRSALDSSLLPGCRAYELVTPPYMEGAYITSVLSVSEDGSRMVASSWGVLGGAGEDRPNFPSEHAGAAYEFARTATGWNARSLTPPGSLYAGNGVFDVSRDMNSTVWALAQPPQSEHLTTDLYLESPLGKFTEMGPATPSTTEENQFKYFYAGASGDLSHVLFTISEPSFRWPFDKTVGNASSLYELVGLKNTAPELVGVTGARESNELVSQCGTRLGSSVPSGEPELSGGGGSMFNAISASGARIYFTAVGADDTPCASELPQPPVDEIFAREEDSSGNMETTPISEPTVSHCSSQPAPPCADAHFEGASLDGSKVFFTSTQKLVEGASEGSSNLYEYDFNSPGVGQSQKLVLVSRGSAAPAVQGVVRISEDGSHVYFVAQGNLTHTKNGRGKEPAENADNLYVFERDASAPEGRTTFIATLSSGDGRDWARLDARPAQVSFDGQLLVFTSEADLLGEGVGPGVQQVFQYDAQTDTLVRASIGQHGYNNNGRAPLYSAAITISPYNYSDSSTLFGNVLAPEDGAVFFESPTALTPWALNNQVANGLPIPVPIPNVYEYHNGEVYLVSDGRDTSTIQSYPGVKLWGASMSGDDVFFQTSDPLVAQDTNTQSSIYDARVDGGFPAPSSPQSCSGDECQGALSQTPLLPTPGDNTVQAGGGNLTPQAIGPAVKTKRKRAAKNGKRKRRGNGARRAAKRHRGRGK
jgi:hypothetical protein